MTLDCFLRRRFVVAVMARLSLSAAEMASATTISADFAADNAFFMYISTVDHAPGLLIATGPDLTTTYAISGVALLPEGPTICRSRWSPAIRRADSSATSP